MLAPVLADNREMITDEEKARLRFDLANANVQSIGRAQGAYVNALLAYICLVWSVFFVGSNEISVHLGGFDLRLEGVWRITPFVLLVLTLAYIGTLTAAVPAFLQLREAEEQVLGSRHHTIFSFDTHKNIIDYLAVLQVWPWGKTRKPTDHNQTFLRRFPHLILPALFVGSIFTSYWAIRELSKSNSATRAALVFCWCCLGLQALFSLRPLRRFLWRFLGSSRASDAYN